ncbi:Uncharacterized protein Rs2_35742 [Raphanus sativus]|nr:Uncharacterized protein Rs2_35742 [Raphanus sativus]
MRDLDSLKEKFKREAQDREKAARKEQQTSCRSIVKVYDAALDKVRETLRKRKEESVAEIRLQAVSSSRWKWCALKVWRRRWRLITSWLYSDDSLRCLDLPHVSENSINQGRSED